MTIDFDNEEQYRKFVRDVAGDVAEYNYRDFIEDVAEEIIYKWSLREKLVQGIFDKLVAQYKENHNENY